MKKNGLVVTYLGRPNQIFKTTEKALVSPYKPKYIPHYSDKDLIKKIFLQKELNPRLVIRSATP